VGTFEPSMTLSVAALDTTKRAKPPTMLRDR